MGLKAGEEGADVGLKVGRGVAGADEVKGGFHGGIEPAIWVAVGEDGEDGGAGVEGEFDGADGDGDGGAAEIDDGAAALDVAVEHDSDGVAVSEGAEAVFECVVGGGAEIDAGGVTKGVDEAGEGGRMNRFGEGDGGDAEGGEYLDGEFRVAEVGGGEDDAAALRLRFPDVWFAVKDDALPQDELAADAAHAEQIDVIEEGGAEDAAGFLLDPAVGWGGAEGVAHVLADGNAGTAVEPVGEEGEGGGEGVAEAQGEALQDGAGDAIGEVFEHERPPARGRHSLW